MGSAFNSLGVGADESSPSTMKKSKALILLCLGQARDTHTLYYNTAAAVVLLLYVQLSAQH